MKKVILGMATLLTALFTVTSCSSDEFNSQQTASDNRINFSVSMQGGTRATGNPQSTQIANGIKVGIYGVTAKENGDNNQYTADGNGALTKVTNDMTWPDGDASTMNIYAYAPYNAEWTTYNTVKNFSVNTDQSTEANYLASDLLYGVPASNPVTKTESTVPLSFTHKLAKLNIVIHKNTGSNVTLTDATVKITGTKISTTFNPSTGAITDPGEVAATEITAATLPSSANTDDASTTVCAIIVPQTVAANTSLVEITAGTHTLIAKVSAATTFASGDSYSFTVNVGNVTAPTTTVYLTAGSASVTDWTDNNMGATTYGIGDYVLNDGKFLKSTDADFETKKANAIAVIFSTNVSTTDQTRGYVAYAMGLATLGSKTWGGTTSWLGTYISTFENACDDLNGWEKSASILNCATYTGLSADNQAKVLANLSNYTLSINDGVTNLSGWFTPSIGQMIQILNGLGNAGLSNTTGFANSNQSSIGWGYTNETTSQGTNVPSRDDMIAVQTSINNYVTAVGGTAFDNKLYATVTESSKSSNANFWHVTFSTNGYQIGQNPGKNGTAANNGIFVIPCLAIKKLTNN